MLMRIHGYRRAPDWHAVMPSVKSMVIPIRAEAWRGLVNHSRGGDVSAAGPDEGFAAGIYRQLPSQVPHVRSCSAVRIWRVVRGAVRFYLLSAVVASLPFARRYG